MQRRNEWLILRAALFFVIAAIGVQFIFSSRSRAQSAAPGSNELKLELQPLSFFNGHWNCSGEFPSNQRPIASHIVIAPSLEGSWLTLRWDDEAPNRFHALEIWGFDKSAKQFTNFVYDNFGGARLFHSPGWQGETLTWTGDALAVPPAENQRFVIERKSSKKFVISWQVHKAQDWITGDRLTCKQ